MVQGNLQIAKDKIGSAAKLFVADASHDLAMIPSNIADLIVSSLVFHYIEDWNSLFSDFARILRDSGVIVFSIHHPHADWLWCSKENYFEKALYEETWNVGGNPHSVKYYHRTLMEMFRIFKNNGFYVDELREPFPISEVEKLDPVAYRVLTTKPRFLFLRLKKIMKKK